MRAAYARVLKQSSQHRELRGLTGVGTAISADAGAVQLTAGARETDYVEREQETCTPRPALVQRGQKRVCLVSTSRLDRHVLGEHVGHDALRRFVNVGE